MIDITFIPFDKEEQIEEYLKSLDTAFLQYSLEISHIANIVTQNPLWEDTISRLTFELNLRMAKEQQIETNTT
jgi:hypothetical protein